MAKRRDKPTNFKEWVQQNIPDAASPEMRDTLAKMVPEETKQAFTEMAQRFQGEPDDPPAVPEPAAAAPPPSEATAPPPPPPSEATAPPPPPPAPTAAASTRQTPRRRGQGPKLTEALHLLREEFPPAGDPPPGMTYKAASQRINAKAKEPIDDEIVGDAIKLIRGNQRRR
jgi:hypothetical protein